MSDVKWIKITTDIFDDEKILLIESMPDSYEIIVVWFKLLCLAGKQNNSGVFLLNDRIPYTESMLATIFRMKESTVRLALKTFEEFGMVELIDGVITIPNWNKHQNLDQLEKRKEYMRDYMKERRKKQNLIATTATQEDVSKVNDKVNGKPNVNTLDKEEDKDKEKDIKDKAKPNGYESILSKVDDNIKETIIEFIKMRKFIKAPMTDRALVLMLNKLKEMSSDPETQKAILEQSIANSWKGIFPLREDAKPRYQAVKPNWDINRQDSNDDIYTAVARMAEREYG